MRGQLQTIRPGETLPHLMCETYDWLPMKLVELPVFCQELCPTSQAKVTVRNLYGHITGNKKVRPYFSVVNDHVQNLPFSSTVYLTAAILPAKKHDFYFVKPGKEAEQEIFCDSVNVPPREDEIRAIPLPAARKRLRVFDKFTSVFRGWREDTPKFLEVLAKKDLEHTKLARMIKNKIDRENVFALLEKNIDRLKEEFLALIVKSTYPGISWNDFTVYCQQKSMTNSDVTLSVLDRLFITVTTNIEAGKQNYDTSSNRELCRHEFLEILVRVASAKYKDKGIVKFNYEALELFLAEMLAVSQPPMIHEFRKKYIWTLPVDDILRSNREGVHLVFTRYAGIKRCMSLADATQLIEKDCGFTVHRSEILKAYGYSKMTIRDESEHFSILFAIHTFFFIDEYDRMTEDEFLEFIARMAAAIYRNDTEKPLAEKIDLLLVRLLGLVHALKYPPYIPEEDTEGEENEA